VISTVSLSPDPQVSDMQQSVIWLNKNVISLSLNGDVNIFNADDMTAPPRVIQGHQSSISALFIDRESSTLFTGSIDGVVISRNLSSGVTKKLIGTDKKSVTGSAHNGKIVGLALNNGSLTSVGFDDTARFASIESGAYYLDFPLNGQPVSLAYGVGAIVVATHKEVAIYQGTTKIASIDKFSYTPTCVAILGQSEIAVGGDDSKTHIYDVSGSTFTLKNTLESRSAISSVAYSPDGNFLAVGTSGRLIELYERATWSEKSGGNWCYHTSKVTTLSWSPSGKFLASGSTDENIFVWDTSKFSSKINFPFSHSGGVTGVEWLNDKFLVSVGNDHVIATWNIPESI
jgi:WD repeat-containing protein 1 (actin-interacting protein 1)